MHPENAQRRSNLASALALILAFGLLTVPVLLSGRGGPSESMDQNRYHQVAIDQMARQWPDLDVSNYPSATSPGLHIVMAVVQRTVGGEAGRKVTRWLNLLLSLGLVFVVYRFAARRTSGWGAALLTAPLLLSQYVLAGAIWLTTDNAALFFAMLAVALALPERPTIGRGLGAGVAATCAVGVRQVHLWTAAPIGFAALLASPLAFRLPTPVRIWNAERRAWPAAIAGLIGAALPVALMVWLFAQWGGLTPPMYADKHNAGPNPATFAFAFAMLGAFGVWFVPAVGVAASAVRDPVVWTLGALGLFAAVVPATSFAPQERAFGSLWRAVELTPSVADRSLLITVFAATGGVVCALLYRAAERADRAGQAILLLLALLGWACAQSLNSMAWQRYFEPITLAFLAWLCALGIEGQPLRLRARWWGVSALAVGQAVIAAASLYREVAMDDSPPSARQHRQAPDRVIAEPFAPHLRSLVEVPPVEDHRGDEARADAVEVR